MGGWPTRQLKESLEAVPVQSFLRLFGFTATAIVLLSSSPAWSAIVYWKNASSGDWSVATNWTGGVPTSSSTASVSNGGTATITKTGEVCGILSLGGTNSGTITMTAGALTVSSSANVGDSGTGIFNQSGGTATFSSTGGGLYVGNSSSGNGTYTLSGTALLSTVSEYVGYSGTGNFAQSGWDQRPHQLPLPRLQRDGQRELHPQRRGADGVDHFGVRVHRRVGHGKLQPDRRHQYDLRMYLGDNAGSSGSYTLSGTGWVFAGGETIGNSGTGSFTQNGGWNNLSTATFMLGEAGSASGTYTLNAGRLYSAEIYVGYYGKGNFIQTGGTNTGGYSIQLGQNASGSGTYTLSNTGYIFVTNEAVGFSGTGIFTQSAGTNSVYELDIGSNSTGRGIYLLNKGLLSAHRRRGPLRLGHLHPIRRNQHRAQRHAAQAYAGPGAGQQRNVQPRRRRAHRRLAHERLGHGTVELQWRGVQRGRGWPPTCPSP